jgi:glycerol-3-phosphate dehydrogenase
LKISRNDIQSVFAGLRPLVKTTNTGSTALASRDHTIIVSKSNLITITGGKWTTYRKMAKDAVGNAAFVAKLPIVKCSTRQLRLHGYGENIQYGDLLSVYGTDALKIKELIKENSTLGERVHPDFPYLKAEVVWAVRNEMAINVEDFLARRTRMLFLNAKAAIESANIVAELMAGEMSGDEKWKQEQVSDFIEIAQEYLAKH